jgi:hypothetical protein
MTLADFLTHARTFADLGDAVGTQLEAVAAGARLDDQNPAALQLAARRFLIPLLRDVQAAGSDDELTESVRDVLADITADAVRGD